MKPPTFAPVYLSLFPHLAEIANNHGYALAAHGSVVTDMDLVAIPWTEEAGEPSELMRAIAEYLKFFHDIWGTEIHGPEAKPHGRIAWLLAVGSGAAIDLSVMPRLPEPGEALKIERAYALRNDQGYWVGIWNDRATAESVRAKTREKEEIIEIAKADTWVMRRKV